MKGVTKPLRSTLINALHHEQMLLWTDLDRAINRARFCIWSIESLEVRDRIIGIAELVGPTDWRNVPLTLLRRPYEKPGCVVDETSIYEKILTEANIEFETPDQTRVQFPTGVRDGG